MENTAAALLEFLHRGGNFGYLWTLPGKKSHWYTVGQPIPPVNSGNVYFGVHPCLKKTTSSTRGKIRDIQLLNCLFAEFDLKDHDDDESAMHQHVGDLSLPPSCIVGSGGGLHAYWFLQDAWLLEDEKQRDVAKQLQAAWVLFSGGDKGAKDLARVLRVPGTQNLKYKPPRDVKILKFNPDLLYTPRQLYEVAQENTQRPPKKSRKLPEDVKKGSRHTSLITMAGRMRKAGSSPEVIYEALIAYRNNHLEAGADPVSDKEVRGIAEFVGEKPSGSAKQFSIEKWESEFKKLGFAFRRNLAGNIIEVNKNPMDDFDAAEIVLAMETSTKQPVGRIERAYKTLAKKDSYHEVVEILEALKWDGDDHIAKLSAYLESFHQGWFEVGFTRWLVGCCAKALQKELADVQTFMLVLNGAQGIGKSYFVKYLAQPLGRNYFIEGPLDSSDKDTHVRLLRKFIWEVSELGATIRKQDVEALKALVSQTHVTVRRAYGKYDLEGPVLCNLIGTVNPTSGLLSDPSGNRRFVIVDIESINWDYKKEVDIKQVWAQAVSLYRGGEPWELTADESKWRDDINESHYVDDPIQELILKHFEIDADEFPDEFMPALTIAQKLKTEDVRLGSDYQLFRQISHTMQRMDIKRVRVRRDGEEKRRGYFGVRLRMM